ISFSYLFSSYSYGGHRDLPSFPTRRSSDLEELFGRLLRLGRHHIQGGVAQVQQTGDVLVRVVEEAPQPRLEVVHGDRGVYADSGAHRSWAPCSSGDSSRARSDTTKSGASSACHRSAIRP